MKKTILAFILYFSVLLVPSQLMAQRSYGADYTTSVGVRLSPFYGLSLKHFFRKSGALEGILHSSWGAVKVTALYEKHLLAFDEPGLRFLFGGGAHVGVCGSRYYNRWYDDYRAGSGGLIGIDGIIGMEYTIQDRAFPVNISLDWKPVIEFGHDARFRGGEVGLTARYIFQY